MYAFSYDLIIPNDQRLPADYVPCKTPLNMTITLDNRPEIPIHPLDVTAEPPTDPTAQFCIGLIQSADLQLSKPDSSIGDMILGVPFMRNVYTVMAYTTPNADGSFPLVASDNQTLDALAQIIRPQLGLLSLTDPTTALKEFNTVRVLNQPISNSSSPVNNTGSSGNTKTIDVGGKHLSVGMLVLIGLGSFCGLCIILVAFTFVFKNYQRKSTGPADAALMDKGLAYRLARPNADRDIANSELTEDELREIEYRPIQRKQNRVLSDATMDSDRTLPVEQEFRGGGYAGKAKQNADELGVVGWKDSESGHGHQPVDVDDEVWDPRTGLEWGDSTFVGAGERHMVAADLIPAAQVPLVTDLEPLTPPASPEQAASFLHHRPTYSDPEPPRPHRQIPSVDMPLLPIHRYPPDVEYRDIPAIPRPPHHFHDRSVSIDQLLPQKLGLHDEHTDLSEFGLMNESSMAGVGTASRTSKIAPSNLNRFNHDSITSMGGATLNGGTRLPPSSAYEYDQQSSYTSARPLEGDTGS